MTQPASEPAPRDLLAMDLDSGSEDWTPTPHGQLLADVLAHHNLVRGLSVLELGGGLGNHTIILARQEPRQLVTTEIHQRLLESTRRNVERNVPSAGGTVEYRVADWLDTEGTFDVVVTNPPFAKSGQRNRRYFIDALILDAHRRLRPGGRLVFIQSSMADIQKSLRRLEENGYEPEILGSSSGPFRDYYFEDAAFMEEIRHVPDGFEVLDDGTHMEKLVVISARLLPWTPPAGAHVVEG